MALCDAHYQFRLVDIGAFGSHNDASVFKESVMGKAFENGEVALPDSRLLPNSTLKFPYFIVADDIFPLKPYLMKPYPGMMLPLPKKIYNFRICTARRTIENTFGILASRWRIFRRSIIADVPTAEMIVAATICLHNFLIGQEKDVLPHLRKYCPPPTSNANPTDQVNAAEDTQLTRLGRMGTNYNARNVTELRDSLCAYLNNEGAVSWQTERCLRGSHLQ